MTRAGHRTLCVAARALFDQRSLARQTLNLPGDACCHETDLTVGWSAPPHARGAAPAYYLDRSSSGGGACLNAPTMQSMQWRKHPRVDAPNLEEEIMTWNAPKIVEVAVGMEINMYACASRKT